MDSSVKTAGVASVVGRFPAEHGTGVVAKGERRSQPFCRALPNGLLPAPPRLVTPRWEWEWLAS